VVGSIAGDDRNDGNDGLAAALRDVVLDTLDVVDELGAKQVRTLHPSFEQLFPPWSVLYKPYLTESLFLACA
jgi:hypothetical protein